MLNAHLDTVGVAGMAEPFSGAIRDGKLYGRGSYDMKGSLAAMLGAAKALAGAKAPFQGSLLVAGVADEENASIGTMDLIPRFRLDAAIVTEPTHLEVCLAHKGFAWIEVTTEGRAAHGSRPAARRMAAGPTSAWTPTSPWASSWRGWPSWSGSSGVGTRILSWARHRSMPACSGAARRPRSTPPARSSLSSAG
ncbi:MAG: M20/M25/M40 family metallo-hydrolase [Gemmatimonadetes bacterium]|nr:M20/M25/M40 family metallo-hydrolase [Gemmatimonadota bacterium]